MLVTDESEKIHIFSLVRVVRSMAESYIESGSEKFVSIARRHFEKKGYRVHSGLQFGVELVLYAGNVLCTVIHVIIHSFSFNAVQIFATDDPQRVHSDFCVHVLGPGGGIDWRTIQTLVRSMPDLHKTLILAHVKQISSCGSTACYTEGKNDGEYVVEEIAIASEHAPFRHKKVNAGVGGQIKKQKTTTKDLS